MFLTYGLTFWLGALMGSFLNVVGLRFLKEESIIWPSSYCYTCGERIKPYDNIPMLSWLLLKGKCRNCKTPISKQYPIIEFLNASLFVAVVLKFGFTLQAGFLLYMVCNFMVILITDFKEQYIFDVNSVGLIPFGLVYSYLNLGHIQGTRLIPLGNITLTFPHSFMSALTAVIGAFFIFFFLNLFSKLLVGKPGFGEGDTRLLMGVGSFFGVKMMVLIFILSFFIQAAVGIPMIMRQWVLNKSYKTAGYLAAGLACAGFPYLFQLWIPKGGILLVVALIFGAIAMIFALKSLRLAKEMPAGLTYLPFGPAIVFATLLMQFFPGPLLTLFRNFIPV